MRILLVALLFSQVFSITPASFALGKSMKKSQVSDPRYYELNSFQMEPIYYPYGQDEGPIVRNCNEQNSGFLNPKDIVGDIDGTDVILDKIINIGKKLWSLVEKGRPVFNVKIDIAHALPQGIHCWSSLERWQAPKSQAWHVTYENNLHGKVIDFIYRVSFIPGGSYKGQGQYVTQATISPAKLDVAWGFTFNAEVTVPTVINMGTKENPIGAMQLNLKWSIDTMLKHTERQELFFVDGTGILQHQE